MQITVYYPPDKKAAVRAAKKLAKIRGESLSSVVIRAVEEYASAPAKGGAGK
jgi:hypothetical protein